MCNYISNPVKYTGLQIYIPQRYKNGREYIMASAMHNFRTWGTEVENIAIAQLSGFDIWVYTNSNQWCRYGSDETAHSEQAFYLSNLSGTHFDPVLDA